MPFAHATDRGREAHGGHPNAGINQGLSGLLGPSRIGPDRDRPIRFNGDATGRQKGQARGDDQLLAYARQRSAQSSMA